MKKLTILSVLFLGSLLVGCGASHEDVYNAKDPSGHMKRQCWETGNGSTRCATDIESKFVGGAVGGTGYGGYGNGLYGASAYPPVLMAPGTVDSTEAERAMERVPGGMVVMHPVAGGGGQQYATTEQLRTVVGQTAILKKDVKQLKKDVGSHKDQSSGEATGQ